MKTGMKKTFFALMIFLASIPSSFAAGPAEFFMNSAGLELLGGASRISVAPGFNYGLFSWMQLGGSIGYQKLSFGDDSVNTMLIQAGPTFNFDPLYANSSFLFVGFSMRKGSGDVSDPLDDPAGSGLSIFLGKRIPVMGQFSYRPSVGLQMIGKTSFVINALAASMFF